MTAKPLIRIVDDDEALTASSAMLLEAMGWDVAVWHSGGAFLDEANLMRPGCLVLDVHMPGLTGLDVQAELERRGSNLPIIFLSAHGSIQIAVHVMRHGAVDFLEKPVEPMTLVQRVAQCVTASLSAKADDAAADEVRRRFDRLTPREREVIDGVLKNAPNKIIARTLGIELSTVKMHRANAFAKLIRPGNSSRWRTRPASFRPRRLRPKVPIRRHSERPLRSFPMLRRTLLSSLLQTALLGAAGGFGFAPSKAAARNNARPAPVEEGEADLVIVGSGAAGLSAGLAALEAGVRKVVILEKAAIAGGHTMLASGSVSAVFGADVDKLIDAMLTAGAGENNPALVETLARQSGAAFEWLAEHGVNWMKTPYRAVGSPGAWSYSTGSAQAGYDYVQCLNRAYHRLGGRILYRTSASSLLFAAAESMDGQARSAVAGIFAERPQGPMLLIRTPAVIIAAGGFTANRAMIAAFRPDIDPQTPTTANPRGELLDGSTGDGILMAQAAGAKLADMSAVEVVPFTGGRLTDFVGGDVWLNAEGRRFVSEGETFDVIRSAVEAQPEGRLWVVSDVKSNKGATLPVKLMSGTVASAESLEALAKALQVPFTTLRASIDRWNQSVKSGWDQDFNRPMPAQAQTIDTPPFYYGEERFSIHYTSGGIAISPKAQVLDRDDHPIPGLYAAGETTGGVHGRTRLGGCALTDCFVFGRIAGTQAALRSQKNLRPR
ncbi:flavocytochrome c [Sutterella wadsworthensis]|uniref:flavocytochrome c n=1 Tax=Sutterella wadsworthensis TaxID=40545 RepID=UPI00396732B2